MFIFLQNLLGVFKTSLFVSEVSDEQYMSINIHSKTLKDLHFEIWVANLKDIMTYWYQYHFTCVPFFPKFFRIFKTLFICLISHSYLTNVPQPQLICSNTCQMWMWSKGFNMYSNQTELSGVQKLMNKAIVIPSPGWSRNFPSVKKSIS